VTPEDLAHLIRSPLRRGVDCGDEPLNTRSHRQQVADALRTGIPIGVRNTARPFQRPVAHLDHERAFRHIPRLIVAAVNMQRSDSAGRFVYAASILPSGDDEIATGAAESISGKRGGGDG